MTRETTARSLIKTISWRLIATLLTTAIVFVYSRKLNLALTVGGIDGLLKIIFYFYHERIWGRIKLGKYEVKPKVIWITGLPGAGKTTVGSHLVEKLKVQGMKVEHLDGDNIRKFFPATGFSEADRNDHVQRASYLASRLEGNGIWVVASFVSPYKASRIFARNICDAFVEVYLSTPLEECERRDPKGLYEKARRGEISHFTGVSDPYERPENPAITLDTTGLDSRVAAELIFNKIISGEKDYAKKFNQGFLTFTRLLRLS